LDKYFESTNLDSAQVKYGFSSDRLFVSYPLTDLSYYQDSSLYNDPHYYKPTLLRLLPQKDSTFIATIAFSHCLGYDFSAIPAILKVIIRSENQQFKIGSLTNYYLQKEKWGNCEIDSCRFFWSPLLTLQKNNIDSLMAFNKRLANKLSIKTIKFNYILASSMDEMNKIKGYVYANDDTNLAFAEILNNTIFVSNSSTFYKHEIVHLCSRALWPYIDSFIDEGLAVYWGDNNGNELIDLLPILNTYLQENKNTANIGNLGNYAIHEQGNLYYLLGGFLCKIVNDRKGIDGIRKMIKNTSEKDIYYAIEKALGVKKADLNAFLRTELEKY
jgi:hypothetical protein